MLKWQVYLGANAMVNDKKSNIFLSTEKKHENEYSKGLFSKIPKKIELEDTNVKSQESNNYLETLKKCSSLEMLKDAILNFDGCDLKKTATKLVFSDGNPSSKIIMSVLKFFIKNTPPLERLLSTTIGMFFVFFAAHLVF